MEEASMDGRWMHSKPVLVSRYWTCIRSKTRFMSAFMTAGGFVDVVATLVINHGKMGGKKIEVGT